MNFKFLIIFIFTAFLFQFLQAQPTGSATRPLGRDFDFAFAPIPTYFNIQVKTVADSATGKPTVLRDTFQSSVQTIVEKRGDKILVKDIFTPSITLYEADVVFAGISLSVSASEPEPLNRSTIIYKVRGKAETIFLNPIRGFVVIIFSDCDKFGNCDVSAHAFGDASNLGAYFPK